MPRFPLPDGPLGAIARFALLIGALVGAVALLTIPLALATDSRIGRAVSAGLYLAGSAVMVLGFVAGNRGPLRRSDGDRPLAFRRGLRKATSEERRSTLALSALLVAAGLVLIMVGVAVDSRVRLV